jgi:hypothetical protein
MAIYRFHVDINVPPHIAVERLRAIVLNEKERPSFWEAFRMAWRSPDLMSPPFVGTVQEDSFRIRRDIRHRNSFLPVVCGRLVPTPTGTRVWVTMFIHPLVLVFMLFWLGMIGGGVAHRPDSFALWGMFVFGIALTACGFVPEVTKANRLITDAVLGSPFVAV